MWIYIIFTPFANDDHLRYGIDHMVHMVYAHGHSYRYAW